MKTIKSKVLCLLSLSYAVSAWSQINVSVVGDLKTQKLVWKEMIQGAQLAAKEIRKKDKSFNLDVMDSGTSASQTRQVILDALNTNKYHMYVVEIDSSKAEVAAQILEEQKKVMITPFASSPRITANRRFIFRACVSDALIGKYLASYAFNTLQKKRAATVYDNGQLYSVTLKDAFRAEFTRLGGTITAEEPILATVDNFGAVGKKIIDSKPDLIFLPFYEETVGRFLSQAVRIPGFLELELLGGDGWADGRFLKTVAPDSLFTKIRATWITHHDPKSVAKPAAAFVRAFNKEYGVLPQTSSAFLAYDAVQLAHRALKKTKDPKNSEALRENLIGLQGFEGSTGPISFKEGNDPVKDLYLIKFENGTIAPAGVLRP